MNPLTQVKNTQKITLREQAIGITDEGSWHAKYKDSAYVYVGGLPFDLTEGDVLAVFAQYGEIVDVNLVRDKTTGKSKGFAFLAYEDQRSTVLAVDNLNGARVVGRIIKVDHVGDYKRKLEEDEEEKQRKREERGVCYAFQRGECNRGDDCKYSHDEERNANTGWGGGGGGGSWKHDQFDGSMKEASRRMNMSSSGKRDGNGIGERDDKPRGVCYAFQRGECNRGDGCKFAHDDQKNNNTSRGGGQFDGSMRDAGRRMNAGSTKPTENDDQDEPPQRIRDTDREREDRHRSKDDDVRRRRDRQESDRRERRDEYREGSYDRKDGRREDRRRGRDDHDDEKRDARRGRDEGDDVRKERERSDRGDDGRGERSVRSRR